MLKRFTKLCINLNLKLNDAVHRRIYTLYTKQIDNVIPFCTVNVAVPYNVVLEPLDVFKYKNCDKVIIKIESDIHLQPDIKCYFKSHKVDILSGISELSKNTICKIEAPIKASINVTSQQGNVRIKNFNGEEIDIKTVGGNIDATKCYSENISMISSTGNITCKTVMQAAHIYLSTGGKGNISTDKLLGLNLLVKTKNGNISTTSSYCNEACFITETGILNLHNIHKKCRILCKDDSKLNLISFDGTLEASMKSGKADIQLVRIEGNSKIEIENEGTLRLKLSEHCLENSAFQLLVKDLVMNEDILIPFSVYNNYKILKNSNTNTNTLVSCPHSEVTVENLSLKEMFNLKDDSK